MIVLNILDLALLRTFYLLVASQDIADLLSPPSLFSRLALIVDG